MSLAAKTRGFALHWNGGPLGITDCDGSKCARAWEGIRRWHIDGNGWRDIAYSFGVCPGCGRRLKGRGWGVRTAANGTNKGNAEWHAVMVLFGGSEPLTAEAKREVLKLVAEHGTRYGRTDLTTHRAVRGGTTACPGPEGIAWVDAGYPAPDEEEGGMYERLDRGDRGDQVELVQRLCNQGGADPRLEPDGVYGARTSAGIEQVTGSNGDSVTPWRYIQLWQAATPSGSGGLSQADADKRYAGRTHSHQVVGEAK